MKKLLLIIVLIPLFDYLSAQTLFTYGKHQVGKEEFLKAYNKNNLSGQQDSQSLRDYLQLYIAFKLKVQAAKDRRLDTLPGQKAELFNFRQQIEPSFLADSNIVRRLLSEAFERSKLDIRIFHLFVPFDPLATQSPQGMNSADTLAAFEKAQQAYRELRNGAEFSSIAGRYSADPFVKDNHGDIGFITVFTLPYELETVAYALPDGGISAPIKSKAGYHILKRVEARPAKGKMSAAQILLAYRQGITDGEKQSIRKLADSLFLAIRNGSDFKSLVARYSSERNAQLTGGVIPDFGVGEYEPAFENTVFSLHKDGEVTAPFETSFGIHIVKRIAHIPAGTDSTRFVLENKDFISQGGRFALARERLAENIINDVGFKKQFHQDDLLWQLTDTFKVTGRVQSNKRISERTVLFSFNKENRTAADWLSFVRWQQPEPADTHDYQELMTRFVAESARSYYRAHLEDFNESFRSQLTEFSEGNLLFEIMQEEVWNKAAGEKKALESYFEKHKSRYTWGPSVSAIYFTTDNEDSARQIIQNIENYIGRWKVLEESSEGRIMADSVRFEIEQIPGKKENIRPGYITSPETNSLNGSVNFIYVIDIFPQSEQKTFEEARGQVINDYQEVLEARWLQTLKKKYPVRINEKVFQSLINLE